ncbi:MAG: ribonuclease Z [Clostridia bacterium]|nr:ribonuclease Z [Clostridia bacterium]
MEIKFIGTGSIGAKSFSASTLIDKEILVDMPNGFCKKAKQLKEDILKIKVILITHLHGDHFLDIPFFMLEKYFYKSSTETKIYCPKGTLKKLIELFEISFPSNYDKIKEIINTEFIEFEELKNEEISKNVFVDSVLVDHGKLEPAYGYIIRNNNKTIGFSGDSKMCNGIESIVKESDIAILDMSLTGSGNDSHMGLNDIENICIQNKNKKIIPTHMHEYTKEVALNKNIDNLYILEDGQIINI